MTRSHTRLGSAILVVALAIGVAACVPAVATTTTLTAAPSSVIEGTSVTLTARVKSTATGTPAGSVTFTDGSRTLGTSATSSGVATLKTSSLASGSRTVVASFKGSAGWGNSTSSTTIEVTRRRYHVALGDSLAAGVGAPAGLGYVPRLTAAESYRTPGLTLKNVSCSGATTSSMLNGGGCSYAQGNQTAAAEAFLRAHAGAVSFITIDIGANDVTPCAGSPDPTCAPNRIATVQTNLTQILSRLHAAAPGVPIIGMTYYNPFLASWVAGNTTGATDSIASAAAFNTALTTSYAAGDAEVASVDVAFGNANTAMTGTYGGVAVPQNVANICAYTWMCSNRDIHANTAGHQLITQTFRTVVHAVVPAG